MFGANDNQGVETASGEVYQFGTDGWKKEYRRRVEDVLVLLFQSGAKRVFWVGQPVMPSSSYDRQMRLVDEIYADVAAKTPGVRYIDAYSLLSKDGRYAQYLPDASGHSAIVRAVGTTPIREPDPACVALVRELLRDGASPLYNANLPPACLRWTLARLRAGLIPTDENGRNAACP